MTPIATPESLWSARLAILMVIMLNLRLSEHLSLGPGWLLPSLELLLLLPLAFWRSHQRRRLIHLGHQNMEWSQTSRLLELGMVALLYLVNTAALLKLADCLLGGNCAESGSRLLYGALNIWVTNVLVFSLGYWELDQGGPLRRGSGRTLDFMFPQQENPQLAPGGWRPEYLDYLFIAFTNASAFSPTDALPLSRRAKALMTVQAATSMLTILLVASRAVNLLK